MFSLVSIYVYLIKARAWRASCFSQRNSISEVPQEYEQETGELFYLIQITQVTKFLKMHGPTTVLC